MIEERQEELAALYTLSLLSGEELSAFEAELRRNPALRQLVDSFSQASAGLALTAPFAEPTAALRARILTSAAMASQPASTLNPAPSANKAQVVPFRVPAWTGWAAAAGFALLAGYTGTQWMKVRSDLAGKTETIAMSEIQVRDLQQKLEADHILSTQEIADLRRAGDLAQLKIAKLASLNGNSPAAVAIAVWNPLKQQGVLAVQNLPTINQDQSYQLWVVDSKHQAPVSGGVFSVDEHGAARLDFHPDERTDAATHFAISREKKGGSPTRQGPIVALGAL